MYKNKEDKYVNFFKTIKEFNHLRDRQKQRGLNDYNILTSVLRASDEVRLHSRMIGSLINPNGVHYQGSLFLEIFLEILNFRNFDLDLKNAKVHIEYKDIDLYITDGIKHLIIENKIWAEDQPCQIIKYINIIKNEFNLEADNSEKIPILDDIRVVYLTARDKNIPREHLLDEKGHISFDDTLSEKLLICSKKDNTKKYVSNGLNNYKVLYKKMSYKKDILEWLYKSKFEVQNITNLNEAIKQYISVVEMITKQYKGNIMNILEFIKTKVSSEQQEEFIGILDSLDVIYKKEKRELKKSYFKDTLLTELNQLKEDDWLIEFYGVEKDFYKAREIHIKFYKSDWKIVYWLRFDTNDLKKMYWAIAKTTKSTDLNIIKNEFKKFKNPTSKHKKTDWSLIWNISEYDLDKNIYKIISNPQELSQNIYSEFKNVLSSLKNDYNCTLEEINSLLEENNDTI